MKAKVSERQRLDRHVPPPPHRTLMFLRWACPALAAMIGWELQSIGLHWATYTYIHSYVMNNITTPWAPAGPAIAGVTAGGKVITLEDSIEDARGQATSSLAFIDAVSCFFPACFCCLSLYVWFKSEPYKDPKCWDDDAEVATPSNKTQGLKEPLVKSTSVFEQRQCLSTLQIYTKVMICAALMFTLKGVLGAITTVPDSAGWKVCQARLKRPGLDYMSKEHTFSEMMTLDEWWILEHHGLLRYCSDMMYSGHTFAVTLFALGLYELLRTMQVVHPTHKKAKFLSLAVLSFLTIGEQSYEIWIMEGTRFHYSMDVLMALVITFLFYTNAAIVMFARAWAEYGFHIMSYNRKRVANQIKHDDAITGLDDIGNSLNPSGLKARVTEINKKVNTILKTDHKENKGIKKSWDKLVSKGDLFIPWCCFPCCCFAGREHLYSDGMVMDIVDEYCQGREQGCEQYDEEAVNHYLSLMMCANDGVSLEDFKEFSEVKRVLDMPAVKNITARFDRQHNV